MFILSAGSNAMLIFDVVEYTSEKSSTLCVQSLSITLKQVCHIRFVCAKPYQIIPDGIQENNFVRLFSCPKIKQAIIPVVHDALSFDEKTCQSAVIATPSINICRIVMML